MKKNQLYIFACGCALFLSCNTDNLQKENFPEVTADFETEAMAAGTDADAADDPAFFYNSVNPENSVIIGTDKKRGLGVYDLQGKLLFFSEVGKVNNVDILDNFILQNDTFPLVGASNRTDKSLCFLKLNDQNQLEEIKQTVVFSRVDDVYGFCFYSNSQNNIHYAFISGKNGMVEQWELSINNGILHPTLVRTIQIPTQVEGLVADNNTHILYIAEEDNGVWMYDARPNESFKPKLIQATMPKNNPKIKDDVEGLSIYDQNNGKSYLVVSSQGNNSYALFNLANPEEYIGSFNVIDDKVDGVEETDGIHVCSKAIGNSYPKGIFIAQDGFNFDGKTKKPQNFKVVDWRKIEMALKL